MQKEEQNNPKQQRKNKMGISIKTDLEWGSIWYIKGDPDQLPHLLVGVVILPGKQFRFKLDFMGDVIEVYDFEASQVPSPGIAKDKEEED